MLVIILSAIVGLVVAYLVTEEASYATIHLGRSILYEIPMFYVVFVSIIVGMLLASLNTIKNLIESKLTIFGQKNDLKKSYKAADELLLKVDKLEEENSALKAEIKELTHPKKVSE